MNRGWVPKNRKDPGERAAGQIEGETEVVGVVRKSEKTDSFTAPNKADSDTWMSRWEKAIYEWLERETLTPW